MGVEAKLVSLNCLKCVSTYMLRLTYELIRETIAKRSENKGKKREKGDEKKGRKKEKFES